ncbi:hypothetical protein L1987_31423 [Smallanthus sonchifolius]|uniref:Uncharacterized protein n=1 Tax=Smallanthus sonchifolius TaxID=185202 RepID=A0ACB9I4W6_9ASTR|nr:hypothetical protein L1987_31423 [Smallanthus sonchifolius]
MNEETRRLSKFPDEVRGELEEHFTKTTPPTARKWPTRDESVVDYVRNGLMPRWSDLDINQHVNNAKYIGWILESVPYSIVENYELASMTLEYRRECTKENVLQSHTYVMGIDNGMLADYDQVDYEHVLELENGDGEIMKGWTTWRPKHGNKLGLESNGKETWYIAPRVLVEREAKGFCYYRIDARVLFVPVSPENTRRSTPRSFLTSERNL